MIENVTSIPGRRDEVLRLGKVGNTTLTEVAEAWGCSTENIANYLHRLQEQKKYAYLVDGKGCFRIFKDFD
jgi:DNA-directed RNA polymerase specialized sigma24 family protein